MSCAISTGRTNSTRLLPQRIFFGTGSCASADSKLTVADVQTVIAQAVAEAQANSQLATIAVTDRVGNVLGVYRMTGARATVTIHSERDVAGGLEKLIVPSELAAIASKIGRIPTVAEYQADMGVINKDGSKIYKYLNFDQIAEYADVAKGVTA